MCRSVFKKKRFVRVGKMAQEGVGGNMHVYVTGTGREMGNVMAKKEMTRPQNGDTNEEQK